VAAKEMAKQAGNSYPTMRNKMDDLIEKSKFKILTMNWQTVFNPFSKFRKAIVYFGFFILLMS
jgi:hypothetical protein